MDAVVSNDPEGQKLHDLNCQIKWLRRWASILLAERVLTDGEDALDAFRRFALSDLSKNEYSFHSNATTRAEAEEVEKIFFEIEMSAGQRLIRQVTELASTKILDSI